MMHRRYWPVLAIALLTFPVCSRMQERPAAASCLRTLPPLGVLPDGTQADLPKIPSWAPSPLGPIPVKIVADLQCNGGPAFGCFTYKTRVIEIKDSLPLVVQWQTLYHELTHSALYHAGITFENANDENKVADAIGNQRTLELIGNWPRRQ